MIDALSILFLSLIIILELLPCVAFIINESDTTQITFYGHQEQNFNIYINNELISGDVNQDGIINIIDVVQAVNLVLSGEFEPLADYNQDGVINVQDIVLIVGIILN